MNLSTLSAINPVYTGFMVYTGFTKIFKLIFMIHQKSLANLGTKKSAWRHTPTKAVRVPQIFADLLLETAKEWDLVGKAIKVPCTPDLDDVLISLISLSLEELLKLQCRLERLIEEKRESLCDRRLEEAIVFLAGRCDGAQLRDGQGFNGCDASFGQWLAERIVNKQPLLKKQAKSALKMIAKYQKQLEKGGYSLPQWEAIESQYPEKYPEFKFEEAKPEKRIEVAGEKIALFSPYDAAEVQKIKNLHTSRKPIYEEGFSHWAFAVDAIEEVCQYGRDRDYWISPEIQELERTFIWEKAEKERLEAEKAERVANEKAQELYKLVKSAELDKPLPNGWTLFAHQQKAVEWLLAHCKDGIYNGGILADHMGLGKTLSALAAAKILGDRYGCPVFVICPASLKAVWRREASNVGIAIEIYSWAKMPQPLENQEYILIADEAHYAQNRKSKRTQRLIDLSINERCRAAWLLTGTPIKNGRPVNLYPLLEAIAHPLAEDRWEYERRYCNGHRGAFGWDNTGAAFLDELAQKTEDCILRRTKADCLDLPEKQRIFKPAEIESKELKTYNSEISELVQDYRDRVKLGEVSPDAQALVTLGILRKVGSKYKVNSAIALAEELLEQNQQVVIFGEFKESVNTVYKAFVEDAELLTGDTPQDKRQEMCDRFQSGESKVFVGTIKAGGVGLTLTAASNVILIDRPWTPGDAEQAEDRCHRIGQSSAVSAFWIQLGLVDKMIDELIDSKQARIEKVLKSKAKILRGLSSPAELAKELLEIL